MHIKHLDYFKSFQKKSSPQKLTLGYNHFHIVLNVYMVWIFKNNQTDVVKYYLLA